MNPVRGALVVDGIQPRTGGSGAPEEFVGRVGTTAWAVGQWQRGQDLILSDPRRMGKTEWLQVLEHRGVPFHVVYVDYEGVSDTEGFLTRTAEALMLNGSNRSLRKRLSTRLGGLFESVDAEVSAFGIRLKAGVTAAPRTRLLEQTIARTEAALNASDHPVLMAMDEVPAAVINIARSEGGEAGRTLLETLRAMRLRTKQVRWVLCGSVGMHHALQIAGATEGVVNDLRNIPFGPLEPGEARELASRLLVGIGVTAEPGTAARLAQETNGIPYFEHAIAARLELAHLHAGQRIGPATVTEAVEGYIHDRDDSRAATHLLNRIDLYYRDLAPAAYQVLDQVARAPHGAKLDPAAAGDRTGELIDLLVDDHYLTEDAGHLLRWRYPLLARIWVSRRRLQ